LKALILTDVFVPTDVTLEIANDIAEELLKERVVLDRSRLEKLIIVGRNVVLPSARVTTKKNSHIETTLTSWFRECSIISMSVAIKYHRHLQSTKKPHQE